MVVKSLSKSREQTVVVRWCVRCCGVERFLAGISDKLNQINWVELLYISCLFGQTEHIVGRNCFDYIYVLFMD